MLPSSIGHKIYEVPCVLLAGDLPDEGINIVVLIVIILLAILGAIFLVCFIAALCLSAYWERTRGKRTKRKFFVQLSS